MAQGKVTVNNLNLAQGSAPEIERKALFIGVGTTSIGVVLSLNTQSDLDTVLGAASSAIKDQVEAAKANGGENWEAFAVPINGGDDWRDAVDDAMLTVSPELIIVCTPATQASDLDDAHAKAEALRTTYARRVAILVATPGIDAGTQTWADYETAQAAIVNGVAAYRVAAVPLLHGNDLGVLAGRLCNRAASIADSPMRVATGAVIGLGDTPVDSAAVPLPAATLATLDSNRLSVVQGYVDYPGTYFGDCNLLDVPGGDYQVIENLRVVDKAGRRIRIRSIPLIADRKVNSTSVSMAYTKNHLSKDLREMARSTVFNGIHFPGEIKELADDAIKLVWPEKYKLQVFYKVTPYNSPKEIENNIILDLANPAAQ